jgi:hypothetical protein
VESGKDAEGHEKSREVEVLNNNLTQKNQQEVEQRTPATKQVYGHQPKHKEKKPWKISLLGQSGLPCTCF